MRRFIRALAAIVFATAVSPVMAQGNWPDKPVKIVVGFTAGSATDVTARLFAQKFQEAFGQPFVVENIAGNSGAIAADRVAKAAPDGYTVTVGTPLPEPVPLYRLPDDVGPYEYAVVDGHTVLVDENRNIVKIID